MYFPLESLWGTDVVELERHHLFHEGLDDDERSALLEAASTLLKLLAKYEKEKRKKWVSVCTLPRRRILIL